MEKFLKFTNYIGIIFRHTSSEIFLVTAARNFLPQRKLSVTTKTLSTAIGWPAIVALKLLAQSKMAKMAKWEDLYIRHDIWFTNKVHVIIDHVPQAIERTGKGLLGN